MRVAITGGTGFVGSHLARALVREGHRVVLIARGTDRRAAELFRLPGAEFFAGDVANRASLERAFHDCDAVAHCAGINRERGSQTYARVHIAGTRNVVAAARSNGVRKLVLVSFLRARPRCGSGYHESKWAAEEIVRASGLDYTILKAGVIYGRGDHMLDHLSRALHTLPLVAKVGFREQPIRPLAVEDLVRILKAALVEPRLSRQTFAVTGPEQLLLSEAVRRVARVTGKRVWLFPLPVWAHFVLAWVLEQVMVVPMASLAQVRILAEGIVEPLPWADELPADLRPRLAFTEAQIRKGSPAPGGFGLHDLRCCARSEA